MQRHSIDDRTLGEADWPARPMHHLRPEMRKVVPCRYSWQARFGHPRTRTAWQRRAARIARLLGFDPDRTAWGGVRRANGHRAYQECAQVGWLCYWCLHMTENNPRDYPCTAPPDGTWTIDF